MIYKANKNNIKIAATKILDGEIIIYPTKIYYSQSLVSLQPSIIF